MPLIYLQENNKMTLKQTCGGCPNLAFGDMGGLKTAYCSHGRDDGDGPIVPHKSELEGKVGGPSIVTLWRVPMECPRPDSEVKKRRRGSFAPKSDWKTYRV